ncbi:MAG: RdgB/HAM1 family non-canonical purine NTP pyrophosphatase [Acidobacteriia bacterium]|nr:RdgB/HAM1 family non-canonical purine NTP pyrophosphatase [Terriglobia bacterium]
MKRVKNQSLTPTIVLATHNPGKLREFRALMEPAGWEIIGLSDLSIKTDVEETGGSFAENARLKALSYSRDTDLPVLADDSGLEVFSLGGRPGVGSARYAGPGASDADRVRKLLAELEHTPGSRSARFVCALALAQWGVLLLETEGECRGEITAEPRGSQGFGYDPVFWVPELGRTYAELDKEEKNLHSHRAHAARALLDKLGRR